MSPGHDDDDHTLEQLVDAALMLAFEGTAADDSLRSLVAERDVPGFTLFAHHNVADPVQVRALTADLQAATRRDLPLLLAADQEGGQLLALGRATTQFAGNMALGAAGDPALAERVGRAMAREMRAMGVNVNYAPVCDVATNPDNPSLGIRSFGDDPERVSQLTAAMVRGLQSEGVAATLKHFPGKGEARVDPHRELPALDLDRARLDRIEFAPFRAGVAAGAKLVMVGHYDVLALTGRGGLPTSLSADALRVVRRDLGHRGVVITDSLDMGAISQDALQSIDAAAALRAGSDLLLCASDPGGRARIRAGAVHAAARGLVSGAALQRSARRTARLRRWAAKFPQPSLEVVGSSEHRDLARELAQRSITLVRDDAGLLPLRLAPDDAIAAVMPAPSNLTPADTSADLPAGLADALRGHHTRVDEILISQRPSPGDIAALRDKVREYRLLVVGTVFAAPQPEQAELVRELLATGVPSVVVALRTPHDLVAFPAASTYLCSYGLVGPSLEALAAALWGTAPLGGRLPARIGELYPTGHGMARDAVR